MHPLFSLTPYTGSTRNEDRFVASSFVEVRRHPLVVSLIGLIPGGIIAAVLIPILQAWVVIFPVLTIAAALILFETRQRRGMRLRQADAILRAGVARRRGWATGWLGLLPARHGGSLGEGSLRDEFTIDGRLFDEPMFVLCHPVVIAVEPDPTADPVIELADRHLERITR